MAVVRDAAEVAVLHACHFERTAAECMDAFTGDTTDHGRKVEVCWIEGGGGGIRGVENGGGCAGVHGKTIDCV